MATFKAVVYSHQLRADGTYNVKIRVIHNRVVRNVPTSLYVDASQVTRGKLKIKDARIIDAVETQIRKFRQGVSALGFRVETMTCDEVVRYLKEYIARGDDFRLDFVEYANDRAARMKVSTARNTRCAVAMLLQYEDGRHPDIREITAAYLKGFHGWLEEKPKRNGKSLLSPASIGSYFRALQAVYNAAKSEYNDEDTGVIVIPGNPFRKIKMQTSESSRRAVGVEVIQAVIDLDSRWKVTEVARDMFVLSFCWCGVNLADMWNGKEVNGLFTYRRQKTARTGREPELCCKVEGEALRIVNKYRADGYILGELRRRYNCYDTFLSTVRAGMTKVSELIGTKVTFYSARHSWATIARNEAGGDKWTVHEALGHSSGATAIDDYYIKPDYSQAWALNDRVLSMFKFPISTAAVRPR